MIWKQGNLLAKWWEIISTNGINEGGSSRQAKRSILVNQVSFLLFVLLLLLFLASLATEGHGWFGTSPGKFPTSMSNLLVFWLQVCLVNLFLNRLGFYTASRFLACFSLPLGLLLHTIFFLKPYNEFYFWFPYTGVFFSLTPYFFLDLQREKVFYYLILATTLVLVLFSDVLLGLNATKQATIVPIVKENIFFYKAVPLSFWLFFNGSLNYLVHLNFRFESQLQQANGLLQKNNQIIQQQSLENEERNEELQQQREELIARNEELHTALEKLRTAQSQLVQAEKMASLGVLTAGIAHEINNPVNYIGTGIIGLQNAISKTLKIVQKLENASQAEFAALQAEIKALKLGQLLLLAEKVSKDIQKGTDRTAEIVKHLRTYSRLDRSERDAFDLHEGIDSALMLLGHQYKDRIEIIKRYDNLPLVNCYPGKINQVFMNLLHNAFQAIEHNGKVCILTKNHPEKVEIVIEDTGPGIPEEIQYRIFDPFFTTKQVGQGTGLGLSIVAGIIDEHGGEINLLSKPNHGAVFQVFLPKGA